MEIFLLRGHGCRGQGTGVLELLSSPLHHCSGERWEGQRVRSALRRAVGKERRERNRVLWSMLLVAVGNEGRGFTWTSREQGNVLRLFMDCGCPTIKFAELEPELEPECYL